MWIRCYLMNSCHDENDDVDGDGGQHNSTFASFRLYKLVGLALALCIELIDICESASSFDFGNHKQQQLLPKLKQKRLIQTHCVQHSVRYCRDQDLWWGIKKLSWATANIYFIISFCWVLFLPLVLVRPGSYLISRMNRHEGLAAVALRAPVGN